MLPLVKSLLEEQKMRIVLQKVSMNIMKKVLQYIEHVINYPPAPIIEKPLKSGKLNELVGEWYATFIDIPQDEIFEIINAADYLGVKSLLDLGCAKIATMMRGKKAKEVIALFNIEKDFTPEQEDCIRKEYKWTEELL